MALPFFICAIALVTRGLPAQRAGGVAAPGARSAQVERMLRAEDQRGRGTERLDPLTKALTTPDAMVRRLAVRGLGRQERPELISMLLPLLHDPSDSIRIEAANALAQSVPRGTSGDTTGHSPAGTSPVDTVFVRLRAAAREERSAAVLGALARSLGRLPYARPSQARDAEEAINTIVGMAVDTLAVPGRRVVPAAVLYGATHGLYALARSRRTLGDLTGASVAVLRTAAAYAAPAGGRGPGNLEESAQVRRLGWMALSASGVRNELLVRAASHDTDPQVRRLAVAHLPNVGDQFLQREVLRGALVDSSFLVRLESVRVYRQLFAATDCAPLLSLTRTPNPHVRLAAIDALGGPCPQTAEVRSRLRALVDSSPVSEERRTGASAWHVRAHALLALSRVDTGSRRLVAREASSRVWQVRVYAARAAAVVRDTALLLRLASDPSSNVRETAIEGLASVAGRAVDSAYVAALRSADYQVVLSAARALRGTASHNPAVPALLDALRRLTAERRENSRDPRLEIVARLDELADSADVTRLRPYVADFDPLIAQRTAALVSRLTRSAVQPAPGRAPATPDGLAALALGGPIRLRITMAPASGGGSFVLRLDPLLAPATTARVLSLVGRRYYDGLTWHRVVPNFVIQGGSPGMNEYIGDAAFMRDELGLASHVRGTIGISTRGRDTGDAQLFINLVDNDRLDHDYTVFARVESGMDVVDGILEGDTIANVARIP